MYTNDSCSMSFDWMDYEEWYRRHWRGLYIFWGGETSFCFPKYDCLAFVVSLSLATRYTKDTGDQISYLYYPRY